MHIAQCILVQRSKAKVHANKNESEACMNIHTYAGMYIKMVATA
jgi:hypothetical protein